MSLVNQTTYVKRPFALQVLRSETVILALFVFGGTEATSVCERGEFRFVRPKRWGRVFANGAVLCGKCHVMVVKLSFSVWKLLLRTYQSLMLSGKRRGQCVDAGNVLTHSFYIQTHKNFVYQPEKYVSISKCVQICISTNWWILFSRNEIKVSVH